MTAQFSQDQILRAVKARDEAQQQTSPDVLQAFFPEKISANGITIEDITLDRFLALERINSPIVRNGVPNLEETIRAILVLSIPMVQVRRLLANSEEFEDAVWNLSGKLDPVELPQIAKKIGAAIQKSFKTAIPAGDGEKKTTPASAGL